MRPLAIGALALIGSAAAAGRAMAVDAAEVLAGFEPAGEVRKCVHSYEISQSRVLDDQTVLFRLGAARYYVNRLPHECGGLKLQGKFSYTLRGSDDLCRGDVIRVLEGTSTGASCLLGDFEKLEKKKAQPSTK